MITEHRGTPIRVHHVAYVPVARTWRIGPRRLGVSYTAPHRLEVRAADGSEGVVRIPDWGAILRVPAAWVLLAFSKRRERYMKAFEGVATGVERDIEKLMGGLSAETVFGDPIEVGERTVLRAAAIERMGGFGFGGGFDQDSNGGGGGGGGGRAEGRPVAVIEISPSGVAVRPVIDFTRIGVTVALALIALLRAARRR